MITSTPTPQKAKLRVHWEPNLRIGIRAHVAEQKFYTTVHFNDQELLRAADTSRADAEARVGKTLDALSLDPTSLERITEWLDLDGRRKIVEGIDYPSSTLHVFVGR